MEDLIDAGLVAHPKAKQRRIQLGNTLQIGYTNGKQLQKRLHMFGISKDQFIKAVQALIQEENQ